MTLQAEPITIRQEADGRAMLVGQWPKVAIIDRAMLRPDYGFHVRDLGQVHIKLANALAIYWKCSEDYGGAWICRLVGSDPEQS